MTLCRAQGRRRPSRGSRAGAAGAIPFLVLLLAVPVIGAANPIDLLWSDAWYDDADADQLLTKTMSPEGLVGLAVLTLGCLLSRAAVAARTASWHQPEIPDSTGARGPPNVTSVPTCQALVPHRASRAFLASRMSQPSPRSGAVSSLGSATDDAIHADGERTPQHGSRVVSARLRPCASAGRHGSIGQGRHLDYPSLVSTVAVPRSGRTKGEP